MTEEIYCANCKSNKEIVNPRVEKTLRVNALKGQCIDCGRNLSKFITNEKAESLKNEISIENIKPKEIKRYPQTNEDIINNWKEENKPKLKKLGFVERKPVKDFLICLLIVVVIGLIVFGIYGFVYYPDTINDTLGIKCEMNATQICTMPNIPDCVNTCDCGNVNVTLKPEINIYNNGSG